MKNENKLIAEFMGYSIRENNRITVPEVGTFPIQDILRKFSTSWDWLMPVVAKIEDLNYELPEDSNLIGDITHGLVSVDIEMTYEAVVEFIKFQIKN